MIVRWLIRLQTQKDWDWRSAHRDKEIPIGFCHISNNTVGLVRVCWDNDFISKEILHHSNVVNALVGFPIFTHIQAIMGADEFEVRLIDVIETMLIICLIHTEDSKICEEREKTKSGDGSCDGGSIMLLDPSLEEMIWKLFGEPCRFHRGG